MNSLVIKVNKNSSYNLSLIAVRDNETEVIFSRVIIDDWNFLIHTVLYILCHV